MILQILQLNAFLEPARMQQLQYLNHLTLMPYVRVSYKIAFGMENHLEDAKILVHLAQVM